MAADDLVIVEARTLSSMLLSQVDKIYISLQWMFKFFMLKANNSKWTPVAPFTNMLVKGATGQNGMAPFTNMV